MNNLKSALIRLSLVLVIAALLSLSNTHSVFAESSLLGLDTNGIVYDINTKTGALTKKAEEAFTSFSLGPIARRKGTLYYIATPSGASENAIYTVSTTNGTISHVDIDRSSGDDNASALFFKGKKLYAIFFNSTSGNGGVFKINPTTGVTTQIVDISDLDIDPIGGSFARIGNFFFILGKPNGDSSARRLIRFRLKAGSAKVFEVKAADNSPVLCDRIKLNKVRLDFVCLASPSTTQVSVCRLSPSGKAKCFNTLDNVERVAGGHSMMSANGKQFFAFVYAPGDSNSQRLIKFSPKGIVKSTQTISTIIIGAKFGQEPDDQEEQ